MPQSPILTGKKALVVGVANDRSIAWGCAEQMHRAGAEIAMTYLNDKARPYVEPLASAVDASLLLPLEVRDAAQVGALFDAVTRRRLNRQCAISRPSSAPGHSRARHQPRPIGHQSRLGHSRFRRADGTCGRACARAAPGDDRGGGRRLRLSREPVCRCDDGRHDLHRRWLSHPRLKDPLA